MTAVRRMKAEMTLRQRKARGARTIEQQMEDLDLPQQDRADAPPECGVMCETAEQEYTP